ncbi:MAG: hypothetical protein ACE5JB_13455 [bacterium]
MAQKPSKRLLGCFLSQCVIRVIRNQWNEENPNAESDGKNDNNSLAIATVIHESTYRLNAKIALCMIGVKYTICLDVKYEPRILWTT